MGTHEFSSNSKICRLFKKKKKKNVTILQIFVSYLITVSAATINKQSKSSTNLESDAVSLTNGSSTNTNTSASLASLETNSTADPDFATKSRIW